MYFLTVFIVSIVFKKIKMRLDELSGLVITIL